VKGFRGKGGGPGPEKDGGENRRAGMSQGSHAMLVIPTFDGDAMSSAALGLRIELAMDPA